MLTLLQHTTSVPQPQFPSLEALLDEPFPRTPEDLLQLEQRLSTAAGQVADQMVLVQLTRAHEEEAFVRQAIAHARAQSPVPLIHKGFRTTSVLLLGGTRLVLETPYLREDRRGRRGRRRHARTGLNLRVSPNEIFQLLALTMMLAPTFDDAQEFGMFCQKQDQIVGLATLYGTTVVVEGTKHHFDRDPLQGFAQ